MSRPPGGAGCGWLPSLCPMVCSSLLLVSSTTLSCHQGRLWRLLWLLADQVPDISSPSLIWCVHASPCFVSETALEDWLWLAAELVPDSGLAHSPPVHGHHSTAVLRLSGLTGSLACHVHTTQAQTLP